jgi:hypothetical protein
MDKKPDKIYSAKERDEIAEYILKIITTNETATYAAGTLCFTLKDNFFMISLGQEKEFGKVVMFFTALAYLKFKHGNKELVDKSWEYLEINKRQALKIMLAYF